MILQALYEYYQRSGNLPRPGLERKEFKYKIVIDRNGTFLNLACLLVDKKRGVDFMVPRSEPRSGKNAEAKPQLLWDNCEFTIGVPTVAKAGEKVYEDTALRKRANFVARIELLPEEVKATPGIHAVLQFYSREEYRNVPLHPMWPDFMKSNSNLIFQLKDELLPVTATPELVQYVAAQETSEASDSTDSDARTGCCLVTGKHGEIIRLMAATPVPGGKSNAPFISFQKSSGYDSYGKEQCHNAPISKEAEFACVTALNALLGKSSRNKFSLGNITAVFWTQKSTEAEDNIWDAIIPAIIKEDKDNPNRNIDAMRTMLMAAYTGKLPAKEASTRFYLLGLAPNAARICVRFWKEGSVGDLGRSLEQHFLDFELTANEKSRRPITALAVLASMAFDYKLENIADNLKSEFLSAIFSGGLYPRTLFMQAIRRIRADRKFPYLRIAAIKAYLNRYTRIRSITRERTITMSLDKENPSVGYQCGRLFAVLEKAQIEAIPGANSTICDRFYGSASTTPVTAFGTLLSLNQHHLSSLSKGRQIQFKNMIGEILDRIQGFPAHLSMDEQGRFAIGYYHQNQDLYRAKSADEKNELF